MLLQVPGDVHNIEPNHGYAETNEKPIEIIETPV